FSPTATQSNSVGRRLTASHTIRASISANAHQGSYSLNGHRGVLTRHASLPDSPAGKRAPRARHSAGGELGVGAYRGTALRRWGVHPASPGRGRESGCLHRANASADGGGFDSGSLGASAFFARLVA